jgi:hypothetical protein
MTYEFVVELKATFQELLSRPFRPGDIEIRDVRPVAPEAAQEPVAGPVGDVRPVSVPQEPVAAAPVQRPLAGRTPKAAAAARAGRFRINAAGIRDAAPAQPTAAPAVAPAKPVAPEFDPS